jgi:hypothetical protein
VTDASAPCGASDDGGAFNGCGVVLHGTKSYNVKRVIFAFYTKTHANGCVLAHGELKSVTLVPGAIAVTMNTKNCW